MEDGIESVSTSLLSQISHSREPIQPVSKEVTPSYPHPPPLPPSSVPQEGNDEKKQRE